MLRTLSLTLSTLTILASFLFLAAHTFERPNLGKHLVCMNANGQRTSVWADTKECHAPRSLLKVMVSLR